MLHLSSSSQQVSMGETQWRHGVQQRRRSGVLQVIDFGISSTHLASWTQPRMAAQGTWWPRLKYRFALLPQALQPPPFQEALKAVIKSHMHPLMAGAVPLSKKGADILLLHHLCAGVTAYLPGRLHADVTAQGLLLQRELSTVIRWHPLIIIGGANPQARGKQFSSRRCDRRRYKEAFFMSYCPVIQIRSTIGFLWLVVEVHLRALVLGLFQHWT